MIISRKKDFSKSFIVDMYNIRNKAFVSLEFRQQVILQPFNLRCHKSPLNTEISNLIIDHT